jgi:hypothetical protein
MGKSEGKVYTEKPRCRPVYDMKMDFGEIGCGVNG